MRAFLLAAGEGRRLRPLTDSVPKCLVPIRGTPLLEIWFRLLEAHGVTDVLVNVHHLPEAVRAFVASYETSMTIETVFEPRLLGSAGTVVSNRSFVAGEKDFLIAYADNLTNLDLGEMVRFHRRRPESLTLGVVPTERPREKGTVVLGPNGEVTEFMEKAEQPRSNLANAGVYVCDQDLFEYCPASAPPDTVLDFGYDVLPRMVPRVVAYSIREFLMDIGTPEAYERAQELWPGSGLAAVTRREISSTREEDPTADRGVTPGGGPRE